MTRCRLILPCLVSLLICLAVPCRGDWSTYRGGLGRQGYTAASPEPGLRLAWVNELVPPPSPAWPAPARGSLWQNLTHIEPRVTDDAAYHPVVIDGFVLFGSSTDDHLYCLHAATGELAWSFAADAPIRYAPAVADERVYFGSDDGKVRCLSLKTGELIWDVRLGPNSLLIPGNGRMISPWPVRTGLIVDRGVVYACAGLFPTQGTFAVALEGETGAQRWRSDLGDRSPQGYLLASDTTLYVPTGRANPFAIDRATGAIGRTFGSPGGTYALLAEDALITGPGNDNTLAANNPDAGQQLIQFQGKHMAIGPNVSYFLTGEKLFALDRTRYMELVRQVAALRDALAQASKNQTQPDEVRAIQQRLREAEQAAADCLLWEVPTTDQSALLATDTLIFVGGPERVTAYDAATGQKRWGTAVQGAALSLAFANGRLIATTDGGHIYSFTAGHHGATQRIGHGEAEPRPGEAQDLRWLTRAVQTLPNPRGWAVMLGQPTLTRLQAVLDAGQLQVLVVCRDGVDAAQLREQLRRRMLYGRRIAVLVSDDGRIPITDYAINLVIDDDAAHGRAAWDAGEVLRVLAPGRGMAWAGPDEAFTRPALEHVGEWTHQYADAANSANSGETHLRRSVALQWFGGPGPSRMIDRHLRGPPPLAFDGKLIMVGENKLIGVDAYNGTEMWELDLPESQRYAMPYDAGYIAASRGRLFAAIDHMLWIIDPETGKRLAQRELPQGPRGQGLHWGYVSAEGDAIFASVIRPTAPITKPVREVADQSYRSDYPLATSLGLFRASAERDRIDWSYSDGLIVNGSITRAHGRVYFIESRNDAARADRTGRVEVQTLLASDAFVVALDAQTGQKIWERPVALPQARNILYLVASPDGKLVLCTSVDAPGDMAHYYLQVLAGSSGEVIWQTDHRHVKAGLYHGEQVHHPVILGHRLVAEPLIYNLATGEPINPDGTEQAWAINRPGHSCGTMSGAGDYLFFRANNPTMLDLTSTVTGPDRFTRLAPTRAGCWINVLPAQGLILIPEASASCVCSYSLQTSMAFRPVAQPTPPAP